MGTPVPHCPPDWQPHFPGVYAKTDGVRRFWSLFMPPPLTLFPCRAQKWDLMPRKEISCQGNTRVKLSLLVQILHSSTGQWCTEALHWQTDTLRQIQTLVSPSGHYLNCIGLLTCLSFHFLSRTACFKKWSTSVRSLLLSDSNWPNMYL